MKLRASSVASAMLDNMYFAGSGNNVRHASFLRQYKFLRSVDEQLRKDPRPVLDKLNLLRWQIVQPRNAFLYLATDVNRFVIQSLQNTRETRAIYIVHTY